MLVICSGIYLALAIPLMAWFLMALKGAKHIDHIRFGDDEFLPSRRETRAKENITTQPIPIKYY